MLRRFNTTISPIIVTAKTSFLFTYTTKTSFSSFTSLRFNVSSSSTTTNNIPADEQADTIPGGGYAFFEDQFTGASNPTPRFDTWEDQMLSTTAKCEDPSKQESEHEKLVRLHDWKTDKTSGDIPILPDDYGWAEEWGPAPGQEGHNDWYKKDRMYMSTEEKAKYDMGMQCAVRKNMLRHQELPYQSKVAAASRNMMDDKPMFYSTKDQGVMAPYTDHDKKDHIAPARQQFIDDWLEKPGVTPENLGKQVSDYNGTGKRHTVKPVPRKPDWQMAPLDED